jgi:hypothetical protein
MLVHGTLVVDPLRCMDPHHQESLRDSGNVRGLIDLCSLFWGSSLKAPYADRSI